MPFLNHYLGNPVLSWLGQLLFHASIKDFHCGLRGFRRDALLALDLQTTGMEFASEMVVKATLAGLKICEVPVILYPDKRNRPPHLNSWRDGWRHLRFLLLYSPRWLFLYPGLIAITLGLAINIWLLPGPGTLGALKLDVNTLLFAAALVLIGFQMVNFAIITRVFAVRMRLLPPSGLLSRFLGYASLERGILIGVLFCFLGLVGSTLAVYYWSLRSFGPLDPSVSLRLVIPGITLLQLGMQIILSSFFLSILELK